MLHGLDELSNNPNERFTEIFLLAYLWSLLYLTELLHSRHPRFLAFDSVTLSGDFAQSSGLPRQGQVGGGRLFGIQGNVTRTRIGERW